MSKNAGLAKMFGTGEILAITSLINFWRYRIVEHILFGIVNGVRRESTNINKNI